jgi:hypothetical protein
MKKLIFALAGMIQMLSTPSYGADADWKNLANDRASVPAPASSGVVHDLLAFRSQLAAAQRRCDYKRLRQAYAEAYHLVEGSGWVSGYEQAVRRCDRHSLSSGVDSSEATGLQVRLIGSDAAIVTGTTKLDAARGGVWVRWLAGYSLVAGRWKAEFAQVHRVPSNPPGPPVPAGPPRGFELIQPKVTNTGSPLTWEAFWARANHVFGQGTQAALDKANNFRSVFGAAVRIGSVPEVKALYAADFTITHGSGYVEGRETRANAVLRSNARLPELIDGPHLTVRTLGRNGLVLLQPIPFAFPGGASGHIRALTVLEKPSDSAMTVHIRAMMINSFDWSPPFERIASGCEPPAFGSPTAEEKYPNCR